MGTPPDPRQTHKARRDSRALHRVGDPAYCRHQSSTAPLGSELAAVSARPGRRDRRSRFPTRGHRLLRRLYVLVFIEHGTRRMHLGGSPRTPPASGPCSRPATSPPASMSGSRTLSSWSATADRTSRILRRRLPGRWHQDPAHRRPGAAHERDLRAPRHPTPRDPRPHADPRRAPPTLRPDRIPGAVTTRPGRTRASPSASPTANTMVATPPLPTSTANGSTANPSSAA